VTVSKKIEVASNIAIIVVAALLGTTLIKHHLLTTQAVSLPNESTSTERNTQEDLSSLNTNWSRNKQTLLLVLSTTCHFCSESVPFYKELLMSSHTTHTIALLPQRSDEAERYIRTIGLNVDEVRQADFRSMKIAGTQH